MLLPSLSQKMLFCFLCVFSEVMTPGPAGNEDLCHLSDRITKHESSRSHLDSAVKLGLLCRANVATQIDRSYRILTPESLRVSFELLGERIIVYLAGKMWYVFVM